MRVDSKVSIYKKDELITKGFMFDIDYSKVWESKERWFYMGKILLLLLNFKREGIFNIISFNTLSNCNKISVEIEKGKSNIEVLLNYLNTEVYKVTDSHNTLIVSGITEIDVYHLELEEENFDYVYCIIEQE